MSKPILTYFKIGGKYLFSFHHFITPFSLPPFHFSNQQEALQSDGHLLLVGLNLMKN